MPSSKDVATIQHCVVHLMTEPRGLKLYSFCIDFYPQKNENKAKTKKNILINNNFIYSILHQLTCKIIHLQGAMLSNTVVHNL